MGNVGQRVPLWHWPLGQELCAGSSQSALLIRQLWGCSPGAFGEVGTKGGVTVLASRERSK